MKKVLITGAGSFLGVALERFLSQWPEAYQADTVDLENERWREKSFAGYDVVYHVAGIAHRKETPENRELYYAVNRDLAVETAKKAKAEGVSQFIYLSSMSVYGRDTGVITRDTPPNPQSSYGKSKLEAEAALSSLADDRFLLCILRPPMVYGKDCKGNFQTMVKLVKKLPVFPKVNNRRSMIYIENLCSFVKMCIDRNLQGLYFPQNREYVQTTVMASVIAETLQRKVFMSTLLGIGVTLLRPFVGMARKGFGSLIYKDTEDFSFEYCWVDFKQSVRDSMESRASHELS